MISKKIVSMFLIVVFFCASAITAENRSKEGPSECVTGLDRIENEEGPRFQEVEQKKEVGKSEKRFPWLLVGGFVAGVAIGALLLFTVFKKKYDIRGTWELTLLVSNQAPVAADFIFSGTKTEGEYHTSTQGKGEYAIEGKKVRFGFFTHATLVNFNGAFIDPKHMEGTYTFTSAWVPSRSGTWTAKKISSATEIK